MDVLDVVMLLALGAMLVCVIGLIRNWNRTSTATKPGTSPPQSVPLGEALLGLGALLGLLLYRLQRDPQIAALWWLWSLPLLFGVVGAILAGKKALRDLYLKPPTEETPPQRQRHEPRNVE